MRPYKGRVPSTDDPGNYTLSNLPTEQNTITAYRLVVASQLAGAVIFDGMPVALGVVHAGDWLGKMLLIALVLSSWRKAQPVTA